MEINPYDAPQVGDAPQAFADAGVGVWRDGDLVVMHERAELPPYCVKTGVRTGYRITTKIAGWATWHWYIAVPLAERWRRWLLRFHRFITPWFFVLIFVAAVAVLINWAEQEPWLSANLDSIESVVGPWATNVLVCLAFITVGCCFLAVLAFILFWMDEPLGWARQRGKYLWLRGADASFLDRLPPWPGDK